MSRTIRSRMIMPLTALAAAATLISAAPAVQASPLAETAAKKCSKGKATLKTPKGNKCVKKCPAGTKKRRVKK